MQELKRLLPYIKVYRNRIILGLIVVTLSNICSTYIPRLVGTIIDTLKSGNFIYGDVMYLILYMMLLTIGSGIFMYATRRTIIDASRLIEYDLRRDFINAVEKQSLSYFHQNPTGSLMALATNDISAAREFLGPAIMYGANTVTTFIFALYFMFSLNASLSLVSLLPLPLIAIGTYFTGRKIHSSFTAVQAQFADLTSAAQESFSGIRVIKSFNRETEEEQSFAHKAKSYMRKNMKLARYQAFLFPSMMVLIGLSQILVLAYGGWLIFHERATFGDITQFFIYINLLIWPVAAIGWVTNLVQRAAASTARLGKVFDIVPEIKDNQNTDYSITGIKGNISFINAGMSYSTQKDVISSFSLEISSGESLGIIGKVGSGKSSLINLLTRSYELTEGDLKIDGNNIKLIPLDILRKNISIVPQEPFLFSLSIAENIRFGKPDASEKDIIHASEIACLHEEVLLFPDKYDTILGERGITLSGGQKQRLAIARAVLKNPSVLILDDALSSVDTNTENRILSQLTDNLHERTSIIISHRINTIKNCSKILVLDDGKISEKGSHEELITADGWYASVYYRQQLEEEIEGL